MGDRTPLPGPAEQRALRIGGLWAFPARGIGAAIGVLPTLAVAPAGTRRWQLLAAAVVLGWCVFAAVVGRDHRRPWHLGVETVLYGGLCLLMPVLDVPVLASQDLSWVHLAVEAHIICAPWVSPARPAVASSALVAAAAGTGTWLAGDRSDPAAAGTAVWLVVVVMASLYVRQLIVRAARQVDLVTVGEEAAHREAQVARARQQAQAEHLATLHDTVAATLMMVGLGAAGGDQNVRQHAARSLEALGDAQPAGAEDLLHGLRRVAGESPLAVEIGTVGEVAELPPAVVRSFVEATGEALRNVERHAGVRAATVLARARPAGAVVEIGDTGPGLAPDRPAGRGIRESIEGRMRRVGGRATVADRRTGPGVLVRLEWAAAAPPAEGRDDARGTEAAAHAQRLVRGAIQGLTALFALLLVKVLTIVLGHAGVYQPAWLEWLAYAGFCAVLAAVLTTRSRLVLVGLALVCSWAASAAVPAEARTGVAHWSLYVGGWLLVTVLAGSPARAVIAALVTHTALAVPLMLSAPLTRIDVVATVMRIGYAALGQLTLAGAIRRMRTGADAAQRIAARERLAQVSRSIAEQVRQDRQRRHESLALSTVPVLEGLSSGTLSPDAPEVRARSLVEAARVRRLLAEGDSVPDSLGHDLGVLADLAARAGVQVDVSYRGEGPDPEAEERRRLIEPVFGVLSAAREQARITVIRGADRIVVSAVADATASAAEVERMSQAFTPGGNGLSVEWVRSEGQVWVTSSWRTA